MLFRLQVGLRTIRAQGFDILKRWVGCIQDSWGRYMVGQRIGEVLGGVAPQLGPYSSDSLGIRAGLTFIILLIALVLGPRIARSVSRVPALIETARERRAARLGDADASDAANGVESDNGHARIAESGQPTGMSRWLGGVVLVCLWIFALYLIAAIWFADKALSQPDRNKLLQSLHDFILDLGISVLVTIVTLVVARALQKSLVASLRHGRLNRNLVVLTGRSIFTLTLIIGLIIILGIWGLGIALPVTLIGALTVALSFALQDILKNMVSGIYLLIEHPFVIGDQITIVPYTGVVENIYIRVTALRTSDGERVLVPNGLLFSSAVVNNSFYQQRRVGMRVALPDNGPEAIRASQDRILLTLEGLQFALRTPVPEVALSKVVGGKAELRAVFWLSVTRTEDSSGALSDAMERVRAQLPEAEVAPLDPIPAA